MYILSLSRISPTEKHCTYVHVQNKDIISKIVFLFIFYFLPSVRSLFKPVRKYKLLLFYWLTRCWIGVINHLQLVLLLLLQVTKLVLAVSYIVRMGSATPQITQRLVYVARDMRDQRVTKVILTCSVFVNGYPITHRFVELFFILHT